MSVDVRIDHFWTDLRAKLPDGRWVRERETEGIIDRETGNGGAAEARPLYDADQTLPKLVAYLAARKGPTPETQALAVQRVEARRLKLETARLALGKVRGELIETQEAIKVFGDLIVYFRQRLLHLPGAVKVTLGLSIGQTLGLQEEIRAALTDLGKGKGAQWGEVEARAPKARRQQQRTGRPAKLVLL